MPRGGPTPVTAALPCPALRALPLTTPALPPPTDLISGTDPSALVEHGQFCREPAQSQVRGNQGGSSLHTLSPAASPRPRAAFLKTDSLLSAFSSSPTCLPGVRSRPGGAAGRRRPPGHPAAGHGLHPGAGGCLRAGPRHWWAGGGRGWCCGWSLGLGWVCSGAQRLRCPGAARPAHPQLPPPPLPPHVQASTAPRPRRCRPTRRCACRQPARCRRRRCRWVGSSWRRRGAGEQGHWRMRGGPPRPLASLPPATLETCASALPCPQRPPLRARLRPLPPRSSTGT